MELKDTKVGNKFIVGPKIGSGSFGDIYLVTLQGTNTLLAMKKEDENAKHPQLLSEAKVLKTLQGGAGIMTLHWSGVESKCNLMVVDLLGPNVEDLFLLCNKKLSLKTILMLTDQMIQRIELLHSKSYIHRDIKPENFLMGLGKKTHIVHIIDFGLSKKYRDPKTQQHIPYRENKNLTGTARYASINSHLGI